MYITVKSFDAGWKTDTSFLVFEAQTIVFHDYIYTLPPEVANESNHYLSSIVQDFLTLLVFRLLFC